MSIVDGGEQRVNATAASLLGFLYWQPMSGHDLCSAVEMSVGNFWNVTRSQIYRELRTLALHGLVEGGEVGPRRRLPYAITDSGRERFREWLRESPGPDLMRSPLLLKFFFGILLSEDTLRRFVGEHRVRHEGQLEYYRGLLEQIRESDPVPAHVVRLGIAFEEMMLHWFDTIPWELWSAPEHQHPRA